MRRGFALFLVAAFASTLLLAYSQEIEKVEHDEDSQPHTQPIPFLEGQELAAAQQEVGDTFELVSSEENSSQPKGIILNQNPEAGSEAQRGEKISVVVSAGPEMAEIPDVVGKPRDKAERLLTDEEFEVEVKTQQSSEENAGDVVQQSPSGGGEVEKGTEVTITVGKGPKPPPEYNVIQDPTGSLTVEVPPSWGVETGADSEGKGGANSWSYYAGEDITSSITTAPSLDAWYEGHGAAQGSGAYIVASKTLAQKYTDDELIHSLLFKGKAHVCSPGLYKDFDLPPYSGKIRIWHHCSGKGNTFFIVAVAPEGRDCVVVLNAKFAPGADETDRKAVLHILETVKVDCSGTA